MLFRSPPTAETQSIPDNKSSLELPPSSMVNLYQLSFGTVAGVYAGVACGGGVHVRTPWHVSIKGEMHRRRQWRRVDSGSGGDR